MENKMKNKIIILIVAVILVAGISIISTIGFNFDLRFQETKQIQLYVGKDFEIKDVKQITNDVLNKQSAIIQKVEVYEDTISIKAKEITEEQKSEIINKINEKYETELSADSIEITSIANTRGRDLIKPYIIPFVIATVIILVYMAIRYYKLGTLKMLIRTVGMVVLAEACLISIMAITRMPIGRLTIPAVITIYMLTLIALTTKYEKQRKEIIEKNKINK